MKILATSDLHGYMPVINTPFDLLFICGDVCPIHDQYYAYQIGWFVNEFPVWLNGLPYKDEFSKVVLIPGNHDFGLERASKEDILEFKKNTNYRVEFLRHNLYEHEFPVSDGLDSLKIFGTPYCSIFGNWAFMVPDETLERKFSQIPDDVDILLSHDSPDINKLGAILEGPWKNDTTGNKILSKHIERIKPKLFLSGHFHSGNHNFEEVNGTYMANVSYVNERYQPVNDVLEIDYDEENRKIVV
jgi:Icc-related predicted phosphoesterase